MVSRAAGRGAGRGGGRCSALLSHGCAGLLRCLCLGRVSVRASVSMRACVAAAVALAVAAAATGTAPGAGCSARTPELTGGRSGCWLALRQPAPPILDACPNFLIPGTCRRRSRRALPTVITYCTLPAAASSECSRGGSCWGRAAVNADATIAAVATAFPLTRLAASRGHNHLSATLSCAPEGGDWECEAGR